MTKPNCFSGLSQSIAGARASRHRSWTRMTGFRLPISFQAETTLSVSISSIRIRNLPSRKVTGSREKMRSLSGLSGKMVRSSGVKSPTNLMRTLTSQGMVSSAESVGSTFSTLRSRRTRSASKRIS